MLLDIFARRYASVPLRDAFEQRDSRLLIQAFRILAEDLYPYYTHEGKEDSRGVAFWTSLNSRLSRELGMQELSPVWFSYTTQWNGNDVRQTHKHTLLKVCENWLVAPVHGSPDEHIKDRLSLIELGFREREGEIGAMNAAPTTEPMRQAAVFLGDARRLPMPNDAGDRVHALRIARSAAFQISVNELNARFRQASYPLHYHNGFIQAATDNLIQETIETPFWSLVAGPNWKNVDHDMKEALDLRDADGRDPSFYAARALESAIKIISDVKGWTHGGEKGAHNYIDNLSGKKSGLITQWEAASLKDFFTHVRNPIGHGPGSEKMPQLSIQQTEWAIEFCMSWIKSLIRRN